MNNAEQFQKLFSGNQRVHGILDANGDYKTVKGQPTTELFQQHLEGKISLGTVPITDKGNCKLGAMDFDDHKKGGIKKDFSYKTLLEKIKFLNLPLVVCKSKSGGAHAYLFLDTYYKAGDIRHILKKFVYALGYERDSVEIFPKQETLLNKDGTLGDGNFINLPYHKGNTRVMLDSEGKSLKLEDALLYSPKRVTSGDNLSKFKLLDHDKSTGRNDRTFAYANFSKKHYPNELEDKTIEYNKIFNVPPLEDKELFSTILKSTNKKDYFDTELEEEPPTELIGYDISEYMARTDITEPEFLIQDLIIEGSTNFTFGEKGKGKTEYILGLINALSRGKDFMQFGIDKEWPCAFFDFEMHPHDPIARTKPYLKKYGSPPKKDYLHIIHWNDQKNRNFPDIATKAGQDLILKYLQKMETATGKKPFCVLDNLRSASGYKENDADSWRPIGLWLKELSHGRNYTLNVVDHSGKSVEMEMRGTSSKADWANVCLQILPEKREGGSMKIKVKFAKARGLRPDQSDPFVCQYDLNGNWTLGQSDKEQEKEELKAKIAELLKQKPKPSQKEMGKILKIAAGKVNTLMKEME